MKKTRRTGQPMLALVALGALLGGSVWLVAVWLGIGISGAPGDARTWALSHVWTLVCLVVWLAGAAALGSSGRTLFACVYLMIIAPLALWLVATILNFLIAAPGLAAILPLGALNVAACYGFWLFFTERGRHRLPLWTDE